MAKYGYEYARPMQTTYDVTSLPRRPLLYSGME
jgi:hypothetical protein